jgi:hypothetical protein
MFLYLLFFMELILLHYFLKLVFHVHVYKNTLCTFNMFTTYCAMSVIPNVCVVSDNSYFA